MSNKPMMSRRKFLQSTGLVGGGLVVGFGLGGCSSSLLPLDIEEGAYNSNAFIQITPDNLVRFYCPRDEMGQGVTTGLGTLISEELDVSPADLDIAFAGAHADYTNPELGVQATGGSTSMRAHYLQLRQVGADVRALILAAAAKDLGVPQGELTTDNCHVVHNDIRHPYGQFVATANAMKLPENTALKPNDQFIYIGKEAARLDAVAKSTGTAIYGIDADIPDMHYAVVRRSPVAGAKLVSVDKAAALAMPGVTHVGEVSSGVAVVAQKYWQAKTAAEKLDLTWEKVALSKVSTETLYADYQQGLDDEGLVEADEGDLQPAFDSAASVVEAEYWTPYLAHAPMEPMNAVLRIENGKAELWSGTQGPGAAQGLVSRFSGIDTDNIQVHSNYLGGSFGRRGTLTHIVEITEIAVAANKPIQLLWSREDDIRNGLYRPASLMKIKAGVDAAGNVSAWQAKRVGGNITPETLKNMLPALLPGVPGGALDFLVGVTNKIFKGWIVDAPSIEGLADDYDFPNKEVSHVTLEHGVPLTFWRSVGHSYTAFAKETMMDELAEKAGKSVVDFRLQNTKHNPRMNNVIRVAGEKMAQMTPAAGRYLGFAAHNSFFTDVAEIVEISVDDGKIRVHKVTCVVDCGLAVNPDVVRGQMEGAVMFGLTATLHGDLHLDNGEFRESNFHDYPILRMNEAPAVDVVIIQSDDAPTGVGEPGLPPIAPAVANAVYAATGQRLRSLPLRLA
jgi:isoquinoline 1-oxidoreductase/isoquinoline 1-oxidoreductase beta subunit